MPSVVTQRSLCERGALGAGRSRRVGARVLRRLLRQRWDRSTLGAEVEDGFDERRHRCDGRRRGNYTADTAADAGAIVVVVTWL